jgi:hypothetical protein
MAQYIFFSAAPATFSTMDHIMGPKEFSTNSRNLI